MKRCLILIFLILILLVLPVFTQAQQETEHFVFHENVMVEMRDGTELATNIFLPKEGGPFPVILYRSPYGKGGIDSGNGKYWTSKGYAVVSQDCRGRFDSEGVWDPFLHEKQDGFDTHEWIGQQNWCNGKIGTAGGSYVGFTQWISAPEGSDYVKTMIPVVPFSETYSDIHYIGGAYQLALTMGWGTAVSYEPAERPKEINWDKAFKQLPLVEWDKAIGKEVFYLRDWVKHNTYDEYWKKRGIAGEYENITVPILNIGGWYDIFSKATLDMINKVKEQSKVHSARRNQFVIMGPWTHGVNQTQVGELNFGEQAKLELRRLETDWYDYWLKGKDTGVEDWPAVKIFVMGENQWRDEREWPLSRTRWTKAYLHSGGNANSVDGDGVLHFGPPSYEEPDTFVFDPNNPVPTAGGNNLFGAPAGPFDQQKVEKRDDVLVYTSAPLKEDTEITGSIKMVLYAASTAKDTDFTAKLVDVHPDGRAINLCDGIIRTRYRNSVTKVELIEPGTIYKYDIDLWVTSNLFKKGHRIRLEVSSSNFPRFDRNPNSGKPFGTDTELLKATQTVYHDAKHPSHVVLPVIPR